MTADLQGCIALVAGATRGAGRGIAVELGAAGATVWITGRSTRGRPSEEGRPETLEDTADLIEAAGGRARPVAADHLDPDAVAGLAARIGAQSGRLDVLVNDIWGGESLTEWDTPVWKASLDKGLRMMRLGLDTHLVTAHHLLPLLIARPGGLLVEMTDGTAVYNATHYRLNPYYDLVKNAVIRLAFAHGRDLAPLGGTAVAVSPGWMRSELMLDVFGVTEATWRDGAAKDPHFLISETPRFVGRAVAALAADPDKARFNGSSQSSASLAAVYGVTDLDGSRPDCWRYLADVVETGRPADTTGYR